MALFVLFVMIFYLCKVLVLLLLQFSCLFLHTCKIAAEAPAITFMAQSKSRVRAGFSYFRLLCPGNEKNSTDVALI